MDFTKQLLQMICEANALARSGVNVDLGYDIKQRYLSLEPEEQKEFKAAIVGLLSHPDPDVRLDMIEACFRLKITEARPVLINMLRDEAFIRKYGADVAAALDSVAAKGAEALLSRIIQRYWNSPSVNRRRDPNHHASILALARGNPIAVAAYLRPLFDDEMEHGFKSWETGPKYYAGGTLFHLLRSIIRRYGNDGVDLIREAFRGIPTEREAYLRVQLELVLERLREQDLHDEQPPEVPDEVLRNLQEYIDSLSPTTWYMPPALPETREDED